MQKICIYVKKSKVRQQRKKDMNTNNFVTLLSNYRNLDLLITLLMRRDDEEEKKTNIEAE